MKKHSLLEHLKDVEHWHYHIADRLFTKDEHMFWIAYERWLNDRVLLTEEDQVAADS